MAKGQKFANDWKNLEKTFLQFPSQTGFLTPHGPDNSQ